MTKKTLILLVAAAVLVTACGPRAYHKRLDGDKTRDRGLIGNDSLTDMSAGIWVDPTGCDHWIIDDGVEGYLSARLGPNGKPVCSGVAPPEYVVGPYRGSQNIGDPL